MKHRFTKTLSAVLATVMCMAMGTTAFADTTSPNATGSEAESAKATIVKELQVPAGTTTPNATFKFTATSTTKDAPTTIEKSVTYVSTDTAADGKIYKTVDLFDDAVFTHAGMYEYTVTEEDGTYEAVDKDKEVMTYSKAAYILTVVVKNKTNVDDGSDGLYIAEIAAQQLKDDKGDACSGEVKVNPNPDDSSNPTSGGVRFVNTYVKGGSIVDPDSGDIKTGDALMTIAKNVTGDIGDKVTPFEFNVSASNPTIAPEKDQEVKAKILKADGKYENDEITISSDGTPVKLAHGQKLVFTNLYAGATVTFKETDTIVSEKNYKVSAVVETNVTSPSESSKVSYDQDAVVKNGVTVAPVSENKESATVTNELNATSPTGIIINNLPFIMMIVVAAAGFVAYITVKRRHSAFGK